MEQALDNLEAAVDAGLMLRGPGGQRHPTLPGDFKQYIRNPGERFRSTEKFCWKENLSVVIMRN